MKVTKLFLKSFIIVILVFMLAFAGCVGFEGSPALEDMYTRNIYPAIHNTYDIGSLVLQYNAGYFNDVYIGGYLDMASNSIEDIGKLNLTAPPELTISAGAITVTNSYHTVDTEGDAPTDFLDTINGGVIGDIVILAANNNARIPIVTTDGNIRLKADHITEDFSFASPAGSFGTYYVGGYYRAPATDANLNQGAPAVSYGTANAAYGAYAFLVASGAGATDAGTVSIVVSGTSIDNDGVRTPADTETIVADITAMVLDEYYETDKRWIGTVTYTLTPADGATTYSADFNYGFSVYDNLEGRYFTINEFQVKGRAGANDNGFDMQLIFHSGAGWTYSAAAFYPGDGVLCSLATDYNTEKNIVNGENFYYEREIVQVVNGDNKEGFLMRIITTANKAVDTMDLHVYAVGSSLTKHLSDTDSMIRLIYNGTNWMEN